ncbi:hypothetical protein KM043_012215 [Ampulex compressa]|nr:hypothetical protein KM043_012215 [Ampulex compressa]
MLFTEQSPKLSSVILSIRSLECAIAWTHLATQLGPPMSADNPLNPAGERKEEKQRAAHRASRVNLRNAVCREEFSGLAGRACLIDFIRHRISTRA